MPQQRLAPHLAQARHIVEHAPIIRFGAPLAVIGDREAVRLVAHALQQVEALGGARKDDRELVVGQPDLLQPLGQPAHGDVDDAQRSRRLRPR